MLIIFLRQKSEIHTLILYYIELFVFVNHDIFKSQVKVDI